MSALIEDSILIQLNSKNSIQLNNTKLSNVYFKTNGILKDESNIAYSTISLISATICYSFYDVNSNNNVLNYSVGASNYSITIQEGNYNFDSFKTAVLALLGVDWDTTINQTNGIITLIYTTAFSVLASSSAKTVFGFESSLTSASNQIVMIYPLSLLSMQKLKICSQLIPTGNFDSTNGNILAIIPITVPQYQVIIYENKTNQKNILRVRYIDAIDIQIYDQDNKLIDFKNIHWNLTFQLTAYRFYYHNPQNLMDILQKQQDSKKLLSDEIV